jgi:hypothetical protein
MSAMPLLAGPLLPPRLADFQALWYFTIVLLGMAAVIGVAVVLTLRTIRPLWRSGDRPIAVLLASTTGVIVVLLLAMAAAALYGLAA